MRTLAAEFPNDNPALHYGAVWVCVDTVGPPLPECPPPVAPPAIADEDDAPIDVVCAHGGAQAIRPSGIVLVGAAPDEPDEPMAIDDIAGDEIAGDEIAGDEIVVEELEPLDASGAIEEVVAERLPATAPPPPDDPFVQLVSALADVAVGAGSPAVASVVRTLLDEGRLPFALDDEATAALAAAGIAEGTTATPTFVAVTHAWRDILRGTSADFEACGATMLDEWAADLLARLLGAPERTTALRRELRARGVAAFGLAFAA